MSSAISALYEPLIARDLASVPAAVAEFRQHHSAEELYLAVARFAVLAYAPSQHAKHAVLAALAAHDVREDMGDRWDDLLLECAYYAASSRQPWSEPPLMTPPEISDDLPTDADELRAAIADRDRLRAERWLAAKLDDPSLERDLIAVAAEDLSDQGHKLILTDAALRLVPILGEKGRFATLRMAVWELTSYAGDESGTWNFDAADRLGLLITECVAEGGSIESAHAVFLLSAAIECRLVKAPPQSPEPQRLPGDVRAYRLGRDLAATLKAHATAKRLATRFPDAPLASFVEAVEHNLETAPSLEEWSFA